MPVLDCLTFSRFRDHVEVTSRLAWVDVEYNTRTDSGTWATIRNYYLKQITTNMQYWNKNLKQHCGMQRKLTIQKRNEFKHLKIVQKNQYDFLRPGLGAA